MRATTMLMALAILIVSGPVLAENTNQTTAAELAAWQTATRTGTPTAFFEYFKKYPNSPRVKTRTGTVRGRYWFKINDPNHQDGVIVTVKGMDVLVNVSLEEAKRLNVINSKLAKPGVSKVKGRTFNYIYGEIVEGGFIVAKEVNNEVIREVIEPRDNEGALIVLNKDDTRLLTWDLRKAKISSHPDPNSTFVSAAAAIPPFNDLPPGLSKEHTPESQEFTVSQKVE